MSAVAIRRGWGWLMALSDGPYLAVVPVGLVEDGEHAADAAGQQELDDDGDLALVVIGEERQVDGVLLDLIEQAVAGGLELRARFVAVLVRKATMQDFKSGQHEIEHDLGARIVEPFRITLRQPYRIVHRTVSLARRRAMLEQAESWRQACAKARERLVSAGAAR